MSPKKLAVFLVFVCSMAVASAQDAPPRRTNPATIAVKKAAPSLWTIESAKDGTSERAVGVAVDPKGIVLVPSESIGSDRVLVAIAEDDALSASQLLAADLKLGVAVVRIASEKPIPHRLATAPRSSSATRRSASRATHPSTCESPLSTGIVSAVRELAVSKETYIQTVTADPLSGKPAKRRLRP